MTSPVENISFKQCNNVFRPNMVKSKELKFQVHDVKRIASRYNYSEISLQPREAQYMFIRAPEHAETDSAKNSTRKLTCRS